MAQGKWLGPWTSLSAGITPQRPDEADCISAGNYRNSGIRLGISRQSQKTAEGPVHRDPRQLFPFVRSHLSLSFPVLPDLHDKRKEGGKETWEAAFT